MRKKIMHISQSNGGVARYLQMLLKYMDKLEYENILIYPKEYINEQIEFEGLVDSIEFIDMVREISIKKDIKTIIELSKLIKKYNPDLIYVHSSKAGALGRIANLITKKRIIYNPHGWAFNMKISKFKRRIYVFVERILARYCDLIIAISEKEKESALKYKICNNNKIKVVFNGIDIENYKNNRIKKSEARRNLNIPEDALVVGMVGRITKQKAPDIFIKSADIIKKKIPNAIFIIVGEGEERKAIEELVSKLGLTDSVIITGWVKETYKYIEAFDIAMLLSRWEGFGLALAEYMVCEVPIIASNVDAIPNVITDNVNGILVDIGDIKGIVNGVNILLKDYDFRKSIIKQSKEKAIKYFDVKRVAKQHDEIILEIFDM